MNVTSIEEIRAQAEPDVIEIPGFRPGKTINVAVRTVDLSPTTLGLLAGNPLVALAAQRAKEGQKPEETAASLDLAASGDSLAKILPAIDAVVQEALVEPTYAQLTAIRPLTLPQKLAIFDYAFGSMGDLIFFRPQ